MSSILFPHTRLSPRMLRIRVAAIGAAAGILLLGLITWLGGGYLGIITSDTRVEAQLTTTGDSLGVNSDVKFRGMRVGRVLEVRTGTRPSARIVLMEEHAEMIPSDVVARVLPGTLFGNEYVDLVSESKDLESIEPIEANSVIKADTSVETLRLMDTLSSAQRLLVALDPASMDTAISQLAQALDGRGADLAAFFDDANHLLGTFSENEELFYEDLELLHDNLGLLEEIEPQLVDAVHDSLPIARVIAKEKKTTRSLLRDTARLTSSLDGFLNAQKMSLPAILTNVAAVLEVMSDAERRFEVSLGALPSVLENGANAIKGNAIQMEAVIGLQFAEPYTSADCPRYGDLEGRNCE
ncbi:virulence factor Mce-like protein [Nocardioides daedukensis]|uniref:Virulence factor Mce-like protein n=1 Tax=Nocardioides daedukensis TaxID=634462 RepID=A0A7Y9S367_9ACTN|nr:MCE family protein [Nocardioides daedukensis]NYG60169.1 virulence factor Mce-like protein [Nocardioides daedukensis]